MKTEELISKLKSVQLCLCVHPDCEPHSEFADRLSDLNEIIMEIENIHFHSWNAALDAAAEAVVDDEDFFGDKEAILKLKK